MRETVSTGSPSCPATAVSGAPTPLPKPDKGPACEDELR